MIYKLPFNKLGVLSLMILIPGCIWGSVQYDRTLTKEMAKDIKPGITTRMNILEWFGPPGVLARMEGVVPFPALETEHGEVREIDSKVFFKYFLERHSISDHHAVYYYFNEGEDIDGVSIPIPLGTLLLSLPATSGDLLFSELWILVNRKTEKVEDYVFLEGVEE
jgi:hypothetical protein